MHNTESKLIDQIYEASIIPDLWASVIDTLSQKLGGRGGSLFVLSDGEMSWDAPKSTRIIMEEYMAGGWHTENPRLDKLLAFRHPGFVQDHDLFSDDMMDLRICREFLLPRDVAFTAATVVDGSNNDLAVFSVDRGLAAGPYKRDEIQFLDAIRPHLARSFTLSSRLKLKQAGTLTTTLNIVGVPAAVLSADFKLSATNALFDDLLDRIIMANAFGRIALHDRRTNELLTEALESSTVNDRVVRSIPVFDEDGIVVGILHVIPARLHARDFLGASGTLLVVAQPGRSASIDAGWLRLLYDLSPSESKVASALASGQSVESIARETGVTQATIRSHVKQVLRKTGFSRQIDFALSVSSLANVRPFFSG